MNGIRRIKIENIKGIKSLELSFDDLLLANRVNILVANNGFGKSSFAKSLEYLKDVSINLNIDDINEETLGEPFVEVEYSINNKWFIKKADKSINNIKEDLECFVINSPLRAGGTGGVAVLTTENINICKIYDKISFNYKLTDFLSDNNWDNYSKLFKLVSYIDEDNLLLELKECKDYLSNQSLIKKIKLFMSSLDMSMTKNEIYELINSKKLIDNILSSNAGNLIFNIIKNYEIKNKYYISDVNTLFNFIQIIFIYNDKRKINEKLKYINSKIMRKYCIDILNKCNTIRRKKIYEEHTNSRGKYLRLKLPKISTISNGQRDLLCFVASFLSMISSGKSLKKMRVCVIDEIFDYLDGSNLIFVQYLISKYIEDNKNITPTIFIIMTHLDPEIFNTFRLKQQKIYYIDNSNKAELSNEKFKNLVNNRESLTINFKIIFESKFIHYNPNTTFEICDFSEEELDFCANQNNSLFFVALMKDNIINYIEEKKYDPLMLACGLRYYCEKYQYDLLDDNLKNEYILAHSTDKKNNVLSNHEIKYDETIHIISLLYNEFLHCKKHSFDSIKNKFIMRIDSMVIRNIIKDFFKEYKLLD